MVTIKEEGKPERFEQICFDQESMTGDVAAKLDLQFGNFDVFESGGQFKFWLVGTGNHVDFDIIIDESDMTKFVIFQEISSQSDDWTGWPIWKRLSVSTQKYNLSWQKVAGSISFIESRDKRGIY